MMRVHAVCLVVLISSACGSGPVAPGCDRRTGLVLADTLGIVAAGGIVSYDVTSPINSNLRIAVTWTNPSTELGLRATILACDVHVGCQIGLTSAASAIQPMIRQLSVDGSRGKQYRIDVLGDSSRDQSFTIGVTYDTGTCT
jgi:hypothetical protein